jgi:hypothetical protein
MKEHPILFNQEMVKAILEGRKSQTRRVVKPQPIKPIIEHLVDNTWSCSNSKKFDEQVKFIRCPYGYVGELLWVRETFCNDCPSASEPSGVCYKANRENQPASDFCTKWKPSIFMPRWASRITLEITDIKVQRLWEITDDDAKAEGIGINEPLVFSDSYKDSYAWLWDKINGKKHPWILNEFVWVISFKRV